MNLNSAFLAKGGDSSTFYLEKGRFFSKNGTLKEEGGGLIEKDGGKFLVFQLGVKDLEIKEIKVLGLGEIKKLNEEKRGNGFYFYLNIFSEISQKKFPNLINSDPIYFQEEGNEGFEVFVEYDENEEMVLKTSDATVNRVSAIDEECFISRGTGSKILCLLKSINKEGDDESSPIFKFIDEYQKLDISRDADGTWDNPDQYSSLIPIAIVNFESGAVTKLASKDDFSARISEPLLGVNEKSGPVIFI